MKIRFSVDSVLFSFTVNQRRLGTAQTSFYCGYGEREYLDSVIIQKTHNLSCHNLDETKKIFNGIYENEKFIDDILQELNMLQNVISSSLTVSFMRKNRRYIVSNDVLKHDISTATLNLNIVLVFSQKPVRCNREECIEFNNIKNIIVALHKMIMEICSSYREAPKLAFVEKNSIGSFENIIIPPGRGGIIIHETVGHMLEADNFFEENNPLYPLMGKKISPIPIEIIDDSSPILTGDLADDRSKKIKTILVHEGSISSVLSDQLCADKYKINNTGNARADQYLHLPIPRMCRTYLKGNLQSHGNLLKEIRQGVLINEILGGCCDISTGSFSFNVSHAYLVKDGEKIAQIRPFTLIANTLSFLQNITHVGNDLDFYSSMCNKKGQMLRVVYGTPTTIVNTKKLEVAYGV